MIRLTALLRRHPDLSLEEFQTHWRDVHAAKILSVPRIRDWLVRYEQHPRVPEGAWTGTEGFDGMTLQWYETLDDFMAWLIRHGRLRADQVGAHHLPAELQEA